MLKANYSNISDKYDENKERLVFEYEPLIEEILKIHDHIRILDLGCGTANYIHCQNKYFHNDKRIEWIGIDPSAKMLDVAKSKEPNVTYINIKAEEIKFPDSYFDLIVCNFAFHHFENKHVALDKIHNSLRDNGIYIQNNIAFEFMRAWWVYNYCPETYFEDLHRFWTKELLVYELEKRGFRSTVHIKYDEEFLSLEQILDDYTRRDISELAIMPDHIYNKGLERIKSELASGKKEYKNYFAYIKIVSRKLKSDN